MSVAVVDLETTGFLPSIDRVVEVGVVLLDERGGIEQEFCTLVNPGRDVGPTSIHGISARDVIEAPSFREIASYLGHLLDGRLVVAHNALFDLRFLGREFGRTGIRVGELASLCTMRMAPLFFGPGTRSLQALCEYMSIPLDAHAALADARATAELLVRMLADLSSTSLTGAAMTVSFAEDGDYLGFQPLDACWADLIARASQRRSGRTCDPCRSLPRDQATAILRQRDSYLGQLVAALPALDETPASMAPYLAVLDEVLEDRLVSVSEADDLLRIAADLGCGPEHVMTAHRLYLEALATAALADGVVTDVEHADLERVAMLLGLAGRDVDMALTMVRSGAQVSLPRRGGLLASGDVVVFTGEMSRSRSDLERAARSAGLEPSSSVSKRTAALVCADPDSQSGKAKKARALGVRVISEAVFLDALPRIAASTQ